MISEDLGRFWHRALGLDPRTIPAGGLAVSSSGRYWEVFEGSAILVFTNLSGNERILVADRGLLPAVAQDGLEKVDLLALRNWSPCKGYSLEFDDIDHVLGGRLPDFPAADIRLLSGPNDPGVASFWDENTEDDLDTLDVEFEGECAYGLYDGSALAAVSRFVNVSETNVSDITVLVDPTHRGKGLATTLVAYVVHEILSLGRTPKYRAGASNTASRAVASKLGLSAEFSLLTWTPTAP